MKPLFILSALLLSGCATYNEHFDCEPGSGVGCKSLSEVNEMIDEGRLPLETHTKDEKSAAPLSHIKAPKVLRVWVAGYTDEEGITHDPAFLSVPSEQIV